MNVLIAFIVGVVVGLVVYLISVAVPFLENYATLLAIVAFVLATWVSLRHDNTRVL